MVRTWVYPRVPVHRIFFGLTLLLLPSQLGIHFWPVWAHVLGRRIDYLSPTLFLTDICVVATLVTWACLPRWQHNTQAILGFLLRHAGIFLALAVFMALNVWVAASKEVALYKWMKIIELTSFAFYIGKTRPSVRYVMTVLLIAAAWSSFIALTQFMQQSSFGGLFWLLGERTFYIDSPGIARFDLCMNLPFFSRISSGAWCKEILRAYATFPHPNVLAGFLTVVIPWHVWRMIIKWKRGKQERTEWAAMLAVGIGLSAALFVTFSRSAWFLTMLTCTIVFLATHTYSSVRRFWSLTVVASIIFFFVITTVVAVQTNSESSTVRRQLYYSAITLWQRSPLLGIGAGNFLVKLPQVLPERTVYFLQPVHNIYALLLSEFGIFGVLLVIAVGVEAVKRSRQFYARQDFRLFSESHVLYLSGVVLLLLGLIDHYALTLQQGQLLMVVIFGLLSSIVLYKTSKRIPSKD